MGIILSPLENIQAASLSIPKPPDYDALLLDRGKMVVACLRGGEREHEIQRLKCSQDILHWIRYFCFLYEPRDLQEPDKPFFPFEFQEKEFLLMVATFWRCSTAQGSKENILYEKSRDMGVSWVVLMVFLWFFMFHRASFLIGSRKEEEVDKTGDMDTPFQKLKYQLKQHETAFPWLLPKDWNFRRDTGNMIIRHTMPGFGQIVGESANADFGRGGRKLAILYDEFAKWEYASEAWRSGSGSTNIRIAVSTPGTDSDKFARLRFQQDGEVLVRTLHWSLHPEKAADLQLIGGKYTSSWYREEQRTNSEDDTAKEVDISYGVSIKGKVFKYYGFGNQVKDLCKNGIVSNKPIYVAWDPGLTFAVLWGQADSYGRLLFLKELVRTGAHLNEVAKDVLDICARYFDGYEFIHVGDPYGSYRQVSAQQEPEYATLQRDFGISVQSKILGKIQPKDREKSRIHLLSNKMMERVGAIDSCALVVDPDECPTLDRAFGGEYKRKVDIDGKVIDQIDAKHPYEDVIDCAGYIGLTAMPWGTISGSRDKIRIRENNVVMRRPSAGSRAIGIR